MFQLEKSLSNPQHPYCHFGTGNLETLSEQPKQLGLDIRDELLKFHDNYYSANIMKLCIFGRGRPCRKAGSASMEKRGTKMWVSYF